MARSKMIHGIQTARLPAGYSNGGSAHDSFRGRARQPGSCFSDGSSDAALLLPLRIRIRDEALHEDVRTAPISKALVGHFLRQEENVG